MGLTALGWLASIASVATVYQSWRKQQAVLFWASVALLTVSAVIWSFAQGWEYGVVYALMLPALLVWLPILAERKKLNGNGQVPAPRPVNTSAKNVARHMGLFVMVIILQLALSLVSSVAFSRLLPVEETGQMTICVLLLPVLWGVVSYHYLASSRKLRTFSIHVGVTLALGLTLVL